MNSRSQRLEALDLARGAGFLVVVLQHSLGFYGPGAPQRFAPQDATVLDFFFLMSGFFAGYSCEQKLRDGQESIAQVISNRAVRLFPIIALGTALGLLSYIIFPSGKQSLVSLVIIALKGLALIPANRAVLGGPDLFPLDVPLWFLFYDWIAYLLFLIALRRFSLKWLIASAAVAVAGLWFAAITKNTLSFGALWDDCVWSIPRSLAGFTIGYILFRLYKPGQFAIGPRFSLLPVFGLLVVVLLPISADWRYSGALQAFAATIIIPAIIFLGAHVQASSKMGVLARWTGRLSLPVYAFHYPLVRSLGMFRWAFHLYGTAGRVVFAVEFISSIALALFVVTCLEGPFRRVAMTNVPSQSDSAAPRNNATLLPTTM